MTAGAGVVAVPRSAVIDRPRLVARLARRFEVRLTLMIGGGGSGKSTALAQALAAEAEGIDVWHPCGASDADDARLAENLLAAVEVGLDAEPLPPELDPIAAIAEHVLAASPKRVCLVLDDVHLLGPSAVLDRLLGGLPANGHVLLAGRSAPGISTARLDAGGQLEEISQDELMMTPEEQLEYANERGIDLDRLAGAEGWPAFIELASTGSAARSRRYLEQEAVESLPPERRKDLATFAFVGGGDDEIAMAVCGQPLDVLVDGIPLVRWSGASAQLHDLWGELLQNELDEPERRRAALTAAEVHRRHRRIETAVDLAIRIGDGDDLVRTLSHAVEVGVAGGFRTERLERWSKQLRAFAPEAPITLLIDGLIAREHDTTSAASWDLLDRAAAAFEASGDRELELVALAQLGYVARNLASAEQIATVMARIERLADDHPPARPFLAFGDAWTAITRQDYQSELAAMESIVDTELPEIWTITRDHLRAHALTLLGRPEEALEVVPRNMGELAVPIPGSLTTELQALWAAGKPEVAASMPMPALSDRFALLDRYYAHLWLTLKSSYIGDVPAAERALQASAELRGERQSGPQALFRPALQAFVQIALGDDEAAAAGLRKMLEAVPFGQGPAEQALLLYCAVPYVLLPEARPFWDQLDLGPAIATARRCARAFVAAREDGDDQALAELDWPEPGVIAADLPLVWATEFALRGVRAGRHEGRLLARWLCEHWGQPARASQRRWLDDPALGEVAKEIISHTPSPPSHDIAVRLLGRTLLLVDGHESPEPDWRRERVRALLTFMALRPTATRDQIAEALWPDLSGDRAAKNLRTTLNYLHGVLEPRRASGDATWFLRIEGQHVALHRELDLDLWRFHELLDEADGAEQRGNVTAALPLYQQASGLWRGDLAADLDYEWLELERIHVRSRFVRGSCRAAELLTATNRPNEAIEILRPVLVADPWHDRSYEALAAAYDAVGDPSSARAIRARATGVQADLGVEA